MSPRYLTDAEIADLFHVSRRTVQNRCRDKAWPHLQIAGKYLFTPAHVTRIEHLHEVAEAEEAATTTPGAGNPKWGRVTRLSKTA
jgi:hypothetical protein